MGRIAIHIDEGLPGYETLLSKLIEISSLVIVEMQEAAIVLKYAHSANRDLQPLEDFILTDKNKKTMFFSWFDFYDPIQSCFFREKNGLWAKSNYKILQLPYNYSDIRIAIKELNLIDYAK